MPAALCSIFELPRISPFKQRSVLFSGVSVGGITCSTGIEIPLKYTDAVGSIKFDKLIPILNQTSLGIILYTRKTTRPIFELTGKKGEKQNKLFSLLRNWNCVVIKSLFVFQMVEKTQVYPSQINKNTKQKMTAYIDVTLMMIKWFKFLVNELK